MSQDTFRFPAWTNKLRPYIALSVFGGGVCTVLLIFYGFAPETTNIGYRPEQPVPFSHALHAGELAIDCRYCHQTVEVARHAAVPSTETCMACHQRVHPTSDKLAKVRDSLKTGEPIAWTRVHDLPDHVYFDHSAHVQKGVGCASCHGRVDRMDERGVRQEKTLAMAFCLDCHRDPGPHIRPQQQITDMNWPLNGTAKGQAMLEAREIKTSTDCSTCHR